MDGSTQSALTAQTAQHGSSTESSRLTTPIPAARKEADPVAFLDEKTALVVDDEPVITELISSTLNAQGYACSTALNGVEAGAYNNLLTARNYQLAFINWGADYPDPQDFLSLQLQTGAGNNNGSYSDPTFDQLTRRADVLVGNDARRFQLYQQAEKRALDAAAWIVLYHGKSATIINPRVHGVIVIGGGVTAPNWATVTIS